MISIDHHDQVAVVKLNRSIINAIGPELVEELAETLGKVKNDPDVHGVVLSSSNDKFFSIGLDIPQLFEFAKGDFALFWHAFNKACLDLYTLSKPTIAAITGHATAGGCVLALCCDYRFIAEGKKLMGLNEIKLGVPVPYVADCILRYLIGIQRAREIMDSGELFPPSDLLRVGMVDQVFPLEEVLSQAIQKAKLVGSLPQQAFAVIKSNRVEVVKKEILACLEEKERLFVECWYSEEASRRLRKAIEKF